MIAVQSARALCAAVAIAVLTACGGGSATTPARPAPATTAPKQTESVTFSIAVPARVMSVHRQPQYVSPATATVQIAINGGAAQSFPVSGGAPCSSTVQPPASGTCILVSVEVPIGDDTFTVTLLDSSGHTLSAGTVRQTIIIHQVNTVHVTFDGVVATLRVALTNVAPPTGSSAQLGVFVTPLDAAGYTMLGAPGALPSVTLTDDDTNGATGLYLAGNDGTCATQAAPPAASVVVTGVNAQNGAASYANACLAYGGQALPNGANITASIASGPSGTAKLTPAAPPASAGIWALGTDSNNNAALEHFNASLAPVAAIIGTNTHVAAAWGLAVDASGNLWLGSDLNFVAGSGINTSQGTFDGYLYMFPPSASGNAAPSSSTHFTGIPGQTGRFPDSIRYAALDGAGNAFVLQYNDTIATCAIWRVALTGGTVAAVKADDCTGLSTPASQSFNMGHGLVSDRGFLYHGLSNPNAQATLASGGLVVRYAIGAGGALARNAVLSIPGNARDIGVDAAGNLLAYTTLQPTQSVGRFPAANFVSGQTTTAGPPTDTYPVSTPTAQDAAGNTYSNLNFGQYLALIPPGNHTVSATANFSPAIIAPAKP